jgi:methylisocitrate lyase
MSTKHPGSVLRSKLAQGTVICPGAFSPLVARAAAQVGFDACYISGGATSNISGYPDVGILTLTEMCRTIRETVDACGLPVVVDADTGFGEIESVVRTVVAYDRAGAAGLHLEDQVFPKRCGHLDGKQLIPTQEMADKVRAACEHRPSSDLIIIARTDARGVDGIEAAIERGNAYREAGADMIFPEGLQSAEEFQLFSNQCSGLLLANMTEFGKTPEIKARSFEEMGYALVIYPVSMLRLAMAHVMRGLEQLHKEGTVSGLVDEMLTRSDLYDLLGYDPQKPWMFDRPQ